MGSQLARETDLASASDGDRKGNGFILLPLLGTDLVSFAKHDSLTEELGEGIAERFGGVIYERNSTVVIHAGWTH